MGYPKYQECPQYPDMIGYFRYKVARNETACDLNWCFCLASINLNELTSHTDMRVLRKFHPVGVFLAD